MMEVSDLPQNKKIILYDGICNLCDSSVQFIIKHDNQDILDLLLYNLIWEAK